MELYTLSKNGTKRCKDTLTRAKCLAKLEKARARAVIGGYTYTWRGSKDGAVMTISNGDTWRMELVG